MVNWTNTRKFTVLYPKHDLYLRVRSPRLAGRPCFPVCTVAAQALRMILLPGHKRRSSSYRASCGRTTFYATCAVSSREAGRCPGWCGIICADLTSQLEPTLMHALRSHALQLPLSCAASSLTSVPIWGACGVCPHEMCVLLTLSMR